MERKLIRTLAAGAVVFVLSTGLWMTAWAEVLVPAMSIPETAGQAEEHAMGIPGAIEGDAVAAEAAGKSQGTAESTEGAGETQEGKEETGSAVKTVGTGSKRAVKASAQETGAEEAGNTVENGAQSSGVVSGRGVREAEAEAEAEREAMARTGPGVKGKQEAGQAGGLVPVRGTSLGIFKTTGYCSCGICIGDGSGLTYSGTVPRARHTISADLGLYPLGTRLMIGDVVYTVEDTGSSITGNWIDIYYDHHEEALAHGVQMLEVFTLAGET